MAEKPKVKLQDTVNPFAHLQATEDAKKKKKPVTPPPSLGEAIGTYAKTTAKKLWPTVFGK